MNYSEQQKKAYNELKKRLVAYMSSVQSIYDNISAQAADIALKSEYDPESNEVFSFSDYPEQRTAIQKMQNDFVTDLSNLIDRGVTKEWQMSNEAQNLLVNSMVESAGVRLNNFYQKKFWQYNDEALNAFKRRKDKGMGLSTKIWQQSSELKTQLEDTISVAIQRGMSAVTLSKRISQYLQNYPKLKQDYGEKFGIAIRCRDCEYKSIRLARTEINMSYRMAEQERWSNLDFVLGYRIKLSKNHTCKGVINFYDICDELEGDYPKDFVWAGWHPSCRCYAIPILMSEDEFERYNRGEETTEKPITEMPKQFDEWLAYNADRIEKAQERGTLPYFLKDNKELIYFIKNKDLISSSNLATLRHDASIFGVDLSPLYKELNRKGATESSVAKISSKLFYDVQLSPLRIKYDDTFSMYIRRAKQLKSSVDISLLEYDFSKIKTREELEQLIVTLEKRSKLYDVAISRHKKRTYQQIYDIKTKWANRGRNIAEEAKELNISLERYTKLQSAYPQITKELMIQENIIRANNFESAIIFDSKGRILVNKKGQQYSVAMTKQEMSLVKDSVFTHNHPRGWASKENTLGRIGNSFSKEDILLAISGDAAEIRAVTPTYTFSMKRPQDGWVYSTGVLSKAIDAENKKVHSILSELIKKLNYNERDIERAQALHWHLVMKNIAKRYGFIYSKTKSV